MTREELQWQSALNYVREHKTWSATDEAQALEMVKAHNHLPDHIKDSIWTLLGEYASKNPMPDDWWLEEDDDMIFLAL